MTGPAYIILDTDTEGVRAEVYFNGIVVMRGDGSAGTHASKLNAWVVQGDNTLAVRLQALSSGGEPARFRMSLRRASPGEDSTGDATLADFTWNAQAQPIGPAWTNAFAQTFRLAPATMWRWLNAARIPHLDPADVNAIADILTSLRNALNARDIDAVVALQSEQIGEQAVALGMDPQAAFTSYRAFLTGRMGAPDWVVQPFERLAIRVETMADGRIHHVSNLTGDPPIRATSGGSTFAIDPYVAKSSGQWTIVR